MIVPMPMLSKGFEDLALALQEASTMMHGDVRQRLSDAVDAAHKDTGNYAHYVDHSGSGKSGNVVYRKNGHTMQAPYSLGDTADGSAAKVHVKDEKKVIPTVTYACAGGEDAKEAALVDLTGDVIPLREGAVGQDGSAYLKLIAPGWGSSGYYSPELLERDGPKIFTKGTKNFWNHQTDIEERERPEGDLRDLASVLTEDAKWDKSGPAGPGLYARAKVFEQFRQPVDDLAKHIGVSIRATGKAKEGKAEGKTGPIIQELSRAISADYVTTPGAGGQILQLFEAARKRPAAANEGEQGMTESELREFRETRAELKKLKERAATADAATEAARLFTTVRVGEAIQERVTRRLLEKSIPMTAAGDLDKEAFKKLWEAETKDEADYVSKMSGGRIVVNMGGSDAPQLTEAERTAREAASKAELKEGARLYGFETETGARIFTEGRAAFNPNYNAREKAAA